MKSALIFIFILLLGSISAQNGFLDHRYYWTEAHVCSGSEWTETYRYTVDSIAIEFNGEAYYEVLRSPTPTGDNFTGTANYIRYDNSGRVFSYDGTNVKLEYDFNLTIGDTFKTHNEFDCEIIVGEIDTITLENGEQRRKWILYDSGSEYLPEYKAGYPFWIEGIGHQWGVFGNSHMCQIDGCGNYTLCVNFDNVLIYQAPHWLDTCWVTINATIDPYDDKIHVYPNPAFDLISISDEDQLIESIDIKNMSGVVYKHANQNEISISNLSTGYYIIGITLKNGDIVHRKFIKL